MLDSLICLGGLTGSRITRSWGRDGRRRGRIVSMRGITRVVGWWVGLVVGLLTLPSPLRAAPDDPGAGLRPLLQEYCMDCHGGGLAEARIDLEAMTEAPGFGRGFKDWEKVVRMVRERK